MSEKLGMEPAFPCEVGYDENGMLMQAHQNGPYIALVNGVSKRLLIAKDVMCALLSNPAWNESMSKTCLDAKEGDEATVKVAYLFTDELLRQENI